MSNNTQVTTIKQAIDNFMLSCKVEGKSHGQDKQLLHMAKWFCDMNNGHKQIRQ